MEQGNHIRYKKLVRTGGTRVLSVGTLVPSDWMLVKVTVVKNAKGVKGEAVTLLLERVV